MKREKCTSCTEKEKIGIDAERIIEGGYKL